MNKQGKAALETLKHYMARDYTYGYDYEIEEYGYKGYINFEGTKVSQKWLKHHAQNLRLLGFVEVTVSKGLIKFYIPDEFQATSKLQTVFNTVRMLIGKLAH